MDGRKTAAVGDIRYADIPRSGRSWREPFRNKRELADWCRDNQPYYKKRIPEVNGHFARMYNLK